MVRLTSKGFATCMRMVLKTTILKILGCTLHTVNKDNSHIPVCSPTGWGGSRCCVHRGTCPESLVSTEQPEDCCLEDAAGWERCQASRGSCGLSVPSQPAGRAHPQTILPSRGNRRLRWIVLSTWLCGTKFLHQLFSSLCAAPVLPGDVPWGCGSTPPGPLQDMSSVKPRAQGLKVAAPA